ncbi:hypothetical protein SAMN05216573_10193 [Bradyrhizobium sp. Rc3b]|uniref:hypothetical protein n=1 Tax=Bradyrhizobium sp. Rc3b TaxID=1855322 RepID=UPI0008E45BBC|nr:hypothetical protein [Bradyrhizobium sp. Rc3b]SFM34685.1 hypothetical protein SAMN05216573_10193 [Bradyrhizobium sp. Rc3b]
MSRFIVATDDMTKDQERAFLEYLKENRVGWWHYLKNLWLVDTTRSAFTAAAIRDKLADEIAPGVNLLVFRIDGTTDWAGMGPDDEKRSMFRWLLHNWKDPT